MLARGKALSKKLVAYHRIPVPAFAVFPMRRKVKRPARLGFPLIVKSASEDASLGIAQASVVENDEKLEERVIFIHEKVGTDAMVEQYIEGRELYVGVLGNDRLRVLPVWEFEFGDMGEGGQQIATAKVKHDLEYQEKLGIKQRPGQGPVAGAAHPHRQHRQAHLPHAGDSTAIPASISACRPTAFPISWKPTPTPKSPRSRNSPKPPPRTASSTATC